MKATTRAVYDFLDKRQGIYVNPHHVEIILDEEDGISVSCSWPGEFVYEPFFIELEFDSPTIDEFITVFCITSVRHLGAIKPALLMELYRNGQVVIFSAINTPPFFYSLHFRKQHNTITAKESNNAESAVSEPLETPKDFISYTLQHFQLAGKS